MTDPTPSTRERARPERARAQPPAGDGGRGQIVRYAFFKLVPEWWRLPAAARTAAGGEFVDLVACWRERMMLSTFSTMGTRADADFMLWQASERLDEIHDFAVALRRSRLGAWLAEPYSYLAMTRRSIYVRHHVHPGQEGTRLRLAPGGRRYLFVYPFVKTHAWYALPLDERQRMMDEHIRVGHAYPSVSLNTTYSYGLDDPEFVLAFESDEVRDFQDLVMRMRETAARPYTQLDTPIFTCISASPAQLVEEWGAAP
jgi:chlorite dismutase